ncbi:hypothetical protein [Streptacidiphilus sp. EB103A]|uniref:hypothetical protein n=1 Tax=Streptacidiphilus sp. EB103A TaxID=3156275 RepID=UPI003513A9EA
MGTSTSAKLIYGYRLQSDNEGWLVQEALDENGEYDGLTLDWLEQDGDFHSAAKDRLRAAVGYEEGDYADPQAWRARRNDANARVAVTFESSGYKYGDLFLAAAVHRTDLGDTEQIDPAAMSTAADEAANERLRFALGVLGLTPIQEKPAWLLTVCRG